MTLNTFFFQTRARAHNFPTDCPPDIQLATGLLGVVVTWRHTTRTRQLQRSTYRKWLFGYQMVTWLMTSRDPERPRSCGAHYLKNGRRYRLGCNGARKGNDYLVIKWSRDGWRYKHDPERSKSWPNTLRAQYLKNGWRMEIDSGFQRTTCSERHMANGIEWSRDWWRHVTHKDQGHDPIMVIALYLEESRRQRLGPKGPPIVSNGHATDMILKGHSWSDMFLCWLFRQWLEIHVRLQCSSYRILGINWSLAWWDYVAMKVNVVPRIWYQFAE